ncbi:hypothetical protein MMC14_008120 [Varicellaria rhodocarpa]|nr:hypothetical protein [Varicellaria rhodocarpa]
MANLITLNSLPVPLRALVVGGTAGIGLGLAQYIANSVPSSHVIIAGRNATIANEICTEAVNGNVSFKRVDASLMANVRHFCEEFSNESKGSKLDMLILSQGILGMGGNLTAEGIETVVALNYYSRMLFVRELLSLNALSDKAIVISVLNGKAGDSSGKSILWDNMDISRTPTGIRALLSIRSVVAHNFAMEDVMMQDLSLYPPPPTSISTSNTPSRVGMTFVHSYPGFVTTDLLKKSLDFPGWLKWIIGTLSISAAKHTTPEEAAPWIIGGAIRVWQEQNEKEKIRKDDGPVRGWFCMSEKGEVYDKPEASEDVRRRVREHTWTLVDQAINGGVKKL